MAQAPNVPVNPTGGGSKGGGGTRGGSKGSSSKSSNKGVSSKKKGDISGLANKVPAHHAHHAMSGEYQTKGKFGNWCDGNECFKG
jgi:hypothetical protein